MSDEDKKISNEELHKEIDLIQSCINRMANNSFILKGWLVSILAAIVALSPEELNKFIVILVLSMATLSFWYLDAFFLRTEKLYRRMYSWVLGNRKLGKRDYQYDLNPERFNETVESIYKIMFSKTLRGFYGVIVLVIIIMTMYYLELDIAKIVCKG